MFFGSESTSDHYLCKIRLVLARNVEIQTLFQKKISKSYAINSDCKQGLKISSSKFYLHPRKIEVE